MKTFIYDNAGRITQIISHGVPGYIPYLNLGENFHTDDNVTFGHYVDNLLLKTIVPMPVQTTSIDKTTLSANGVDTVTLSNAASGIFTATNITTRETVTGSISGTDIFSTTVPGSYKIKVESWPYLDFETTIVAS